MLHNDFIYTYIVYFWKKFKYPKFDQLAFTLQLGKNSNQEIYINKKMSFCCSKLIKILIIHIMLNFKFYINQMLGVLSMPNYFSAV